MTDWTNRACYVPQYLDYMAPAEDNILLKEWDSRVTDWALRCILSCFEPFRPLFITHFDLQTAFTLAYQRVPFLCMESPFPTVYELTRETADSDAMQFTMTTAWRLLEALQLALDYSEIAESAFDWVVLHAKTSMLAEDAMDNWITAMKWVLGQAPCRNGIDEDIFGHP